MILHLLLCRHCNNLHHEAIEQIAVLPQLYAKKREEREINAIKNEKMSSQPNYHVRAWFWLDPCRFWGHNSILICNFKDRFNFWRANEEHCFLIH
jgi:hypothetical protein